MNQAFTSIRLAVVSFVAAACNPPRPLSGPAPTRASSAPVDVHERPSPTLHAGLTWLDTAPADALTLDVSVSPWQCEITDPNGIYDRQLHVPIGRAIRLQLHAKYWRDDLAVGLEDKFVNVPRDASTELVFRIEHEGTYRWRCPVVSEPVHASPADDYLTYQRLHREGVDPTTRADRATLGSKVFEEKGCNACHTTDGTQRVGASFGGLWGTQVTLVDGSTRVVDELFIKDAVVNPRTMRQSGYRDVMPSYEGVLHPAEIHALAAFIESLPRPTR